MPDQYRVTVTYNKTGKDSSKIFSGSSPDLVIGPAKGHFDGIFGEGNYKWKLFEPFDGVEDSDEFAEIVEE